MGKTKLRRYIKRGIAVAGLGLGLAAGVLVPVGMAEASTGPTVTHRLVTVTNPAGTTATYSTLDMSWQ
jgi:hypothetical protein